jgi:alpha-methylacyl-CoA racemase
MGICAALFEAQRSGKGQVIDCAMTDGAASLASMFFGMRAAGIWTDERDANILDGGAHFYDVYECKDAKWIAIGSIEPQFHALMLEKLGLSDDPDFQPYMDRRAWPALSERLAAVVKTKTREEWRALLEGTDVCFAPVLSWDEATQHPHNVARQTFTIVDEVVQPNAAPRFSRTPSRIQGAPPDVGANNEEVLAEWGIRSPAPLRGGG